MGSRRAVGVRNGGRRKTGAVAPRSLESHPCSTFGGTWNGVRLAAQVLTTIPSRDWSLQTPVRASVSRDLRRSSDRAPMPPQARTDSIVSCVRAARGAAPGRGADRTVTDTAASLDAGATRPLAGIRVVACADTIGGGYVARLLSDLGADVVVVEPPGGSDAPPPRPVRRPRSPSRRAAPPAAYYLAGTRSIVVDPTDRDELARLLAARRHRRADRPRSAHRRRAEGRRSGQPRARVVDISTFGRCGPLASAPGGDLMALAESGMLSVLSTNPAGRPADARSASAAS